MGEERSKPIPTANLLAALCAILFSALFFIGLHSIGRNQQLIEYREQVEYHKERAESYHEMMVYNVEKVHRLIQEIWALGGTVPDGISSITPGAIPAPFPVEYEYTYYYDDETMFVEDEYVSPFIGTSLEGMYVDISQMWDLPGDPDFPVYINIAALTPTFRMCHYCLRIYDYPWELTCMNDDCVLYERRESQTEFEVRGFVEETNPGLVEWNLRDIIEDRSQEEGHN